MSAGKSPRLAVVVPALNEEAIIGSTVQRLVDFIQALPGGGEIIVVDDGSTDATAKVVSDAARSSPNLRLLSHAENRGKGRAVRTGMLAAKAGIRVFTDADLAYGVEGIEALLEAIESGADVAVGVRPSDTRRILSLHPLRAAASHLFARIVRNVALTGFKDTQCGLKGLTAAGAELIFRAARVDGFGFDVELLCLAQMAGLTTVQVSVARVPNPTRHRSSVRLLPATFGMLREIFQIRRWVSEGAYDPALAGAEAQLRAATSPSGDHSGSVE